MEIYQWLGRGKEASRLGRYWEGCKPSLPANSDALTKLKGMPLRTLLNLWNEQWDKPDIPDERPKWEDTWRERLKEEDRRAIWNGIVPGLGSPETSGEMKQVLKDLEVLVEASGESWLIGNYAFWVFFFKGEGRFWRVLAEGKGLAWLQDRLHDWNAWWQQEPHQSLYRIFTQLLVLLVCGMVTIGHIPTILRTIATFVSNFVSSLGVYLTALLQPEMLMSLVSIVFSVSLWIRLVEHPLRRNHKGDNTRHRLVRQVLYALPFALWTLIQVTVWLTPEKSFILSLLLVVVTWMIFAASLFFPYKFLLPQEWDWFRFLVVILPVCGLALFWPVYQLKNFLLEWLSLLAITFVILRLWWLALSPSRPSQPSIPHQTGQRVTPRRFATWLQKILGFVFEGLPPEHIPMTFLVVLLLILGHLLWLRQQTAQVHSQLSISNGQATATVVSPPFLSAEDEGDMLFSVTSHVTQTLPVTVTIPRALKIGTNDNPGSPIAVLVSDRGIAYEQFIISVPPGKTIYKLLSLRVLPLTRLHNIPATVQVLISGADEDISIPVLSRFLPRMYASSNTFLAWLFGLACGIAEVVAAGFLAMRDDKEPVSSNNIGAEGSADLSAT